MKQPKKILYYGKDEPLAKQIEIKAGPLSLFYEAGDLRYIKINEKEIVRRVYVAVRDHNWDTIIPAISNIQINSSIDSFKITYDVKHIQNDVNFIWKAEIVGKSDGSIRFNMFGEALTTFWRNRIGFCILLPMDYAGSKTQINHVDGTVEESVFPKYIAPQLIIEGKPSPVEPFSNMRGLMLNITPQMMAELHFDGDIFEMEDQRNWTDASFKIYSTPLKYPSPVEIKTGTKISQTFSLNLKKQDQIYISSKEEKEITFSIEKNILSSLPNIGLDEASHDYPLDQQEIERLKDLNLSHQRINLYLSNPNYKVKLRQLSKDANKLDINLEVALFLSNNAEAELIEFIEILEEIKPRITTWLIFHENEISTSEKWILLCRKYLKEYNHNIEIGSGTNVFFADLNRSNISSEIIDFVSYSINPQVHAFDNLSLIEYLAAQGKTIESAKKLFNNKPIAVTPITFKMRFNPNASKQDEEIKSDQLPSQVDERQMSLFGAGWTLGSLKYLCESCPQSLTYYETTGWRGVMETKHGSPVSKLFNLLKGKVFPLYHVFADVGEFKNGKIITTISSDPLKITGLALQKKNKTRVIIANLNFIKQKLTVKNLRSSVHIRYLDENSFDQAIQSPEDFRTQILEKKFTVNGSLKFELLPFGLVCIDSYDE